MERALVAHHAEEDGDGAIAIAEQRDRDPGGATDLFSFGAIVFEMLTLGRAFARDESDWPLPSHHPLRLEGVNGRHEILRRIALAPRPRARMVRPELPAAIDAVLSQALAPQPEDRFASARALIDALEAAHPRGAGSDRAPPGRTATAAMDGDAPVAAPRRRRRWIGTSLAASVAAAVVYGLSINAPLSPAPPVPLDRAPTVTQRASDPSADPIVVAPAPPAKKRARAAAPIAARRTERPPTPPPSSSLPDRWRADPTNAALRVRLEAWIASSAAALEDPVSRASIERCVALSRISNRAEDLTACAELAGIRSGP